jgi:hypothetical protein
MSIMLLDMQTREVIDSEWLKYAVHQKRSLEASGHATKALECLDTIDRQNNLRTVCGYPEYRPVEI